MREILTIKLDEIDSTQDLARDIIKNGTADKYDGVVITAKKQFAGRGQKGSLWSSEKGGLYISIIRKTDEEKLSEIQYISYKTAQILLELLHEKYGIRLKIKKPNDIYAWDGKRYRKISGILIETTPHNNKRYIIIGIGVNFTNPIPMKLKSKAVNLFEITSKRYNPKSLEKKLVEKIFQIEI
ncbi:MAG: biotin--[acetyl-CoA-carboxylase] ligase [Elusimicrobiales bacterium]